MKKTLLTFIILLCVLSAQAWIFPGEFKTETIKVNVADMKFRHATKGTVNNGQGYVLYDSNSHLLLSYGKYLMWKTDKGAFAGRIITADSKTNLFDLSISITDGAWNCPIKCVRLKYYLLAKDNTLEYGKFGFNQTNFEKFTEDGKEYRTIEYTYDVPATVLMLFGSDAGEWDTTSPMAKEAGQAVKGVIITEIEVEYTTQVVKPQADFISYIQNTESSNKLIQQIDSIQTSALAMRSNATSSGDVNMDGSLNSADVVTIYNNIINGTTQPTKSGQTYVDLGLPSGLLWATCNLGASSPEGYGDYFSWAEKDGSLFSGKLAFDGDSYKPLVPLDTYNEGDLLGDNVFLPYNTMRYRNQWQSWKMPTQTDFEELYDNCDQTEITLNGVKGMLFTSKHNKSSIFFPYAGYIFKGLGWQGREAFFWTKSSLHENEATSIQFYKGYFNRMRITPRAYGMSVRLVTH